MTEAVEPIRTVEIKKLQNGLIPDWLKNCTVCAVIMNGSLDMRVNFREHAQIVEVLIGMYHEEQRNKNQNNILN